MDRNIKENSFKNTRLERNGRDFKKKPNKILLLILTICGCVVLVGVAFFVLRKIGVHNKTLNSSESAAVSSSELINDTMSLSGENKLIGQNESSSSGTITQSETAGSESDENTTGKDKKDQSESNISGIEASAQNTTSSANETTESTTSSVGETAQSTTSNIDATSDPTVTDSDVSQSTATNSPAMITPTPHSESASTSDTVSAETSTESKEENNEETPESDFIGEILEKYGTDGDYIFVQQDADLLNEPLAKYMADDSFTTGGLERLFVISYVYYKLNQTNEKIFGAESGGDLRDLLLGYLERDLDESEYDPDDEYLAEIMERLGGYNPSAGNRSKQPDKDEAYDKGIRELQTYVNNLNRPGNSFTEPAYQVEDDSKVDNHMTLGWCEDYFRKLLEEDNERQYSLFTKDAVDTELVPSLLMDLKKTFEDPNIAWCAWNPGDAYQLVVQIKSPKDHVYFFGITADSELPEECQDDLAKSLCEKIKGIDYQDTASGDEKDTTSGE